MSSTARQSPSVTTSSSNWMRPRFVPAGLIGAYGTTCFWPESAIAANHSPRFSRRSHARISGLFPLFPRHTSAPSTSTV